MRIQSVAIKPHGQDDDEKAGNQGIENHFPSIELQLLLIPGADARDTDQKERRDLTPDEVAVVVDEPTLHPGMDINKDPSPEVQPLRIDRIEEELQQERDVHEAPEYPVPGDKVLTFFHYASLPS